jgi:hypothetical protein
MHVLVKQPSDYCAEPGAVKVKSTTVRVAASTQGTLSLRAFP